MTTDPTGERAHLEGAGMDADRKAKTDEQASMTWWNALTEAQRAPSAEGGRDRRAGGSVGGLQAFGVSGPPRAGARP